MLYLFRLLLFFISIDQETVLNWFGIENSTNPKISQTLQDGYNFNSNISLQTFRLIIQSLCEKTKDGLTLSDIENIIFFILFVRFIILAIRYNLKTSFYITCIGLFAGYLWYKHLIDLIAMYRSILLKFPLLDKLGMDSIRLQSMSRQTVLTDLKLEDDIHWYNPGHLFYYAFTKGIINVDSEMGLKYYIDPISMVIANLQEPTNSNILTLYYKVYNKIIPKIYEICSKFWNQLSGVAAYAVITRIGKRYCPYLIRWHWTFLLIIGMIEQIFIYFIYRVYYFQTFVIIPQIKTYDSSIPLNLILQINILNIILGFIVLTHIGFILFGLFHSIWGQYFYMPFFVENTELHIGPRPKNSIYSGGYTSWQDPEEKEKEKKLNHLFPKLWYGYFGRGTQDSWKIVYPFKKFLKKVLKKIKKQFRR